jgi:hypothetical protein
MVNITYVGEDGSEGMIPTGLALGYSREYEYNTSNVPLLEQIAAVGGGRVVGPSDNPFEHNLEASPTVTPIWQYLVAFAACLFPLEIFVRRVVVNFGAVFVAALVVLRKMPALGRFIPKPAPKPAPVTGTYSAARTHDYRDASEAGVPSFGVDVRTQAPTEGAVPLHEAEEGIEALEPTARAHSEYTQQLLAAKKRAIEQRKRRSVSTEDKERS